MPAADAPPLARTAPPAVGADTELLAAAARTAGAVALGFLGRSPEIWTKGDSSPVTAADLAADRHLAEVLRGARPDYGWLSEESAAAPGGGRRTFVVDPIDGTRAFIAGTDDWTISLAVVEDGRPVAAAIFRPVGDELFVAALGGGAWLGGNRIATTAAVELAGSRVAGPANLFDDREVRAAGVERVPKIHSLALRLASVAAGRIDAAAASERACHWDLAAADLLVHEAGGRLTDLSGRTVRYDAAHVRHPALVAAGPGLHDAFAALVAGMAAPGGKRATGAGKP